MDRLTTLGELVGASAGVVGVGLQFGIGWALIVGGPLMVGVSFLAAGGVRR